MKIVLYTYDFEPITVIEVDIGLINRMVDNHCPYFRVAVPSKESFVCCEQSRHAPMYIPYKTVEIRIHDLHFFGKRKLIFLVDERDLVNAFDLRSITLPGQRDSLERAFQEGISSGIQSLLTLAGGLNDD